MSEKIKVGIVGLGLIGGSIEKRLMEAANGDKYEVLAVSESQQREHKLEDLSECNIVFLCGPQSQIPKNLEQIAKIISRSGKEGEVPADQRAFAKTLITDVASSKSKIQQKANDLGLTNFIPGHPMAGTEKQGYEASFPELFENAKWVLAESSERTQDLESMIKDVFKSKLVIMDAVTHDKAVAAISHLPLVLSIALAELASKDRNAMQVTGPGFESMTRLAKGNPDMSREIMAINNANIKELWQSYKEVVDSLLGMRGTELNNEIYDIKESFLELV